MKALLEKKNSLIEELEGMVAAAKAEVRAFTSEEDEKVEALKAEIRGLEKLMASEEEVRTFEKKEIKVEKEEEKMTKEESRALEVQQEERAFLNAVRTGEIRELTAGTNGSIIPVSIASDIIEEVMDQCPLLNHADVYNIAGELRLPKYHGSDLFADYVEEFDEVVESSAAFDTLVLKNHIVGVLTKISKSLINRAGFDVRSFIVTKVAKAIVDFLEEKMLVADAADNKIEGVINTDNEVVAEGTNALKTEDLIELQMAIPTAHQAGCMWIMHKDVLKALRKLKTGDGFHVLNNDLNSAFGWTLLGKPIYLSDSMPNEIATGKDVMIYMNPSGYAVKMTNNIEMQLLMEKYASQYSIGVCAFCELDAKIADTSKIAKLKMK